MVVQTIRIDGKPFVILEKKEYERLAILAKAGELPPLPAADSEGNYPAVEYARASIARSIIRDRVAAKLTQKELAERAGVRVETLCRIETGKHIPSVPTLNKIDRALKEALSRKRRRT